MKNVMVVYYSQTGQLKEILKNFCSCQDESCKFDFVEIKASQYVFPLTWKSMLNMFPESVMQMPCDITYSIPKECKYDLIILGFQTWFLHLSLPILSFLKTEDFNELVAGKDVCLVMDCRNSWQEAMSNVENSVIRNNGRIAGKYVFANSSGNIMGVLPILNWFFTGNKKIGCLPDAGVSQTEIEKAYDYGQYYWKNGCKNHKVLIFPSGVKLMPHELETYAKGKFHKWAVSIQATPNHRNIKLLIFAVWLIGTLLFIAPFKSLKRDKDNNHDLNNF